MSGWRLLLLDPTTCPTESSFALPAEGRAYIGRHPSQDIRIDDTRVTRQAHAIVTTKTDGVWLQRGYSVRVNGQQVEQEMKLSSGDVIEIAPGLRLQIVLTQ
jgi:pSer/pThr/pTyr-binding forkhead associated (FHA) protein